MLSSMRLLSQLSTKGLLISSNPAGLQVTMPQTRSKTVAIIARTLSGDTGKYRVEHDVKNRKFVIKLDPDNNAYIDYEQLSNNEVLLHHTEVPKLYGGKGIGKILADEAFGHFEKTGQKMVITCTYLQKFESNRDAPVDNK